MSNEASITMLLYRNLSPDEQTRLEALDSEISATILSAGIADRCGWLASNERGVRVLGLVAWTRDKRSLIEISSTEILAISDEALLRKLVERLHCAAV